MSEQKKDLKVYTESGSIYYLNRTQMTWDRARVIPDLPGVFPIRTRGGTLLKFPKIEVGKPMDLVGPSLTPGGICRLISTSPVVNLEEVSHGDT